MRRFFRVLITAGPTRERLDSIRFISNLSTGNMGYELARAALNRGYKVTLISGPTCLPYPQGVKFVSIEGAREMEKAVKKNFKDVDCLFMASAVCDWRPQRMVEGKIKRGPKKISLNLVPNPDILERVGRDKDGKVLVGFALESKDLVKNAIGKLKKKNLDLIVANKIDDKTPFGAGRTDVIIIDRYGRKTHILNASKRRIAREVLKRTEGLWQGRR